MKTHHLDLILLLETVKRNSFKQLLVLQLSLYLDFGGDEESRDADELQPLLFRVVLGEHESVKEVLRQVERLSVKQISLTYLKGGKIVSHYM